MPHLRKWPGSIIALAVVFTLAGTASAHRLPHRGWAQLNTAQRVHVLRKQIKHDRYNLAFWRGVRRESAVLAPVARKQIRWHQVSLRIAKRSLKKLQRLAASSGAIPWYWRMLHECEQPGSWTNGGPDATFSGGLGIHRDIWGEFGGYRYASYAGGAGPWGQIAVARNIMRRYGASPWAGCSPKAQAVINQEHIG
jgi:Transglycosylase-like domain